MCVTGLWSCGETSSLVAFCEFYIEIADEGLHIVISPALQVEGRREGEVLNLTSVHVKLLDEACVSDDLFWVDHINKWLADGGFTDTAHVETINLIPPVDLLILVGAIFDAGNIQGGSVRHDHATTVFDQPFVSGEENSVQHGLIQQAIAHPLADNDINMLNPVRKLNLFHLALHYRDDVVQVVGCYNLFGVVGDAGALNSDDFFWLQL